MPVTASNYLINFTDPGKTAISIIGGSKNGPGFVDQDTSLVLLGQFTPLYGKDINENFLHLLENFNNPTPPLYPVEGQLWHSSDPSYDNRSLSSAIVQYQGDFYLRTWIKNSIAVTGYWSLPRTVLVDDDISNLTSYQPLPGDLWVDTKPNSVVGSRTGTTFIGSPERVWDFTELKVFDAVTNKFESIGRNYIKHNDNGTQTITSSLTVDNVLTSTGSLIANTAVIGSTLLVSGAATFTVGAVFSNSLTVGTDLFVTGNTELTGTLLLKNNISIINNSNIVSDGNATFINGQFNNNIVAANDVTAGRDLIVGRDLSTQGMTTLGTNITLPSLYVVGGTSIQGDVSIYGSGHGTLSVSGATTLDVTSTKALNVDGTLTMVGTNSIVSNQIDLQSHTIINVIDPTLDHHVANKKYVDDNYLRRNDVLGAGYNDMDAVLTLSHVNQDVAVGNASTVGYVNATNASTISYVNNADSLLTAKLHIGGLDTELATSRTTNADLNTLIDTEVWYGTSSNTNAPPGMPYYIIDTKKLDATESIQTAYSDTQTARRRRYSTVLYTSWIFTTNRNGDSAELFNVLTATAPTHAVTKAQLDAVSGSITNVPVGMVMAFAGSGLAGSLIPNGWLECDGTEKSATTYPALATICGTIYGNATVLGYFKLPDLRGEFLRGLDNARGVDVGRSPGSHQNATAIGNAVSGAANITIQQPDTSTAGANVNAFLNYNGNQDLTALGNTIHQTRPRNLAMFYCIKT